MSSVAAFSSSPPFTQLFPLFLSDLLTVHNAVSEEPRTPEAGKKFFPKVTSFSSCCPGLSSLRLLPRSSQAAQTPSAVASCSLRPLPNSVFYCSSFRAFPYERSSLTSPISEVTGMERLEIGVFCFFKKKQAVHLLPLRPCTCFNRAHSLPSLGGLHAEPDHQEGGGL